MASEPSAARAGDRDRACVAFLQWALPQLQLRWPGFRRVRKRVCKQLERRRRALGLGDLDQYRAWLTDHDAEWRVLDDLCRVVVSQVYRDRAVFDRLRDEVLPRLAAAARSHGDRHVAAWSAGCACGEEAWTLRVLWDRHLAPRWPDVELLVLATDADRRVLERARRATYPDSSLRHAPADWATAVFERIDRGFRLADRYRHGVAFVCQDLRAAMPRGPFDLILCRNLAFTYFAPALQRRVAADLLARLRPQGELVLGAHEQLPAPPPTPGGDRSAGTPIG